jgi:hypothetical protein
MYGDKLSHLEHTVGLKANFDKTKELQRLKLFAELIQM